MLRSLEGLVEREGVLLCTLRSLEAVLPRSLPLPWLPLSPLPLPLSPLPLPLSPLPLPLSPLPLLSLVCGVLVRL